MYCQRHVQDFILIVIHTHDAPLGLLVIHPQQRVVTSQKIRVQVGTYMDARVVIKATMVDEAGVEVEDGLTRPKRQ